MNITKIIEWIKRKHWLFCPYRDCEVTQALRDGCHDIDVIEFFKDNHSDEWKVISENV